MPLTDKQLCLSIIAPAFNEAACLPTLVESIVHTLRPLELAFEIILVDDASTDQTPSAIATLRESYPEVHAIRHIINSGQSAAIISGIHVARGTLLVTLDADMQNPPSQIPFLLAQLTPEIDAVCGVRSQRNDPFVRRLSSKIANTYRNWITGVPVKDAGCGLRLIRKSAVIELPAFNGLHRFIPTILKLQGFRVKEVPVTHSPRLAGQSKYGINNRLWRGLADCFAMRWYARRVISPRRNRSSYE
jgi:dolichol-phosphate mannosyltransferase